MLIGRTLKDVDIFGYAIDKKMLFAQVTYCEKEQATEKIKDLKGYDNPRAHLVFFCDCQEIKFEDNILYIPWRRVERWLRKNEAYLRKLFESTDNI